MLHAKFMAPCFTEGELLTSKACGNKIFDFFCSCDLGLDPMTFIYELDPYSLEIDRMCKYEINTSRLSEVIM